MADFQILKSQVLQAQETIDRLSPEEASTGLVKNLLSLRFVRDDTASHSTYRRALVAMPDTWHRDLAEFEGASNAGLAYIERCLRRYGFVSIADASHWLKLEETHRQQFAGGNAKPAQRGVPAAERRMVIEHPRAGREQLQSRLARNRSKRSSTGVGFFRELHESARFFFGELARRRSRN